MDLRSRTIPTGNRYPDDQSEFGEKDGTHAPSSPASTLLLEEDTLDFAGLFETEDRRKDSEAPIPQQPLSHGARDRDTSPLVRWQLPIRTPRESIANFDDAMRDFMDSERCPQKIDRGTETCPDYMMEGIDETPFHPRDVSGGNRRHIFRKDVDGGAMSTPAIRQQSPRRDQGNARRAEHPDERGIGYQEGLNYERLLPTETRYRGRASAHRPAMYQYESPRMEYRVPELLFNEPRPYFPSFSGRHDEWDAFWLKFEIMAKRYNWSGEKQKEQLLFCLKDEAMNFAASLGPEIRESISLFSQALRDRFSHRTPAETVRANLNNIKKSSKETIQEYASRVRTMMVKAYPDIRCSETFNQMTIHHLLQGLPDQTIAYEVLIKKPTSLTEAVDMITWHECCKESTRKKVGIRQLSSFDKDDAYPYVEDPGEMGIRRINGKKFVTEERLIQFGRDLKATIEKLFREEKSSPEDNDSSLRKGTEESMPKRPDNRTIICYYCNEPGHVLTRCPYRLKNQAPIKEKDKKKSASEAKQQENGNGLSLMAGAQTQ